MNKPSRSWVYDAIYQDSLKAFLVHEKTILVVFLAYMDMAAILINGPWPFE